MTTPLITTLSSGSTARATPSSGTSPVSNDSGFSFASLLSDRQFQYNGTTSATLFDTSYASSAANNASVAPGSAGSGSGAGSSQQSAVNNSSQNSQNTASQPSANPSGAEQSNTAAQNSQSGNQGSSATSESSPAPGNETAGAGNSATDTGNEAAGTDSEQAGTSNGHTSAGGGTSGTDTDPSGSLADAAQDALNQAMDGHNAALALLTATAADTTLANSGRLQAALSGSQALLNQGNAALSLLNGTTLNSSDADAALLAQTQQIAGKGTGVADPALVQGTDAAVSIAGLAAAGNSRSAGNPLTALRSDTAQALKLSPANAAADTPRSLLDLAASLNPAGSTARVADSTATDTSSRTGALKAKTALAAADTLAPKSANVLAALAQDTTPDDFISLVNSSRTLFAQEGNAFNTASNPLVSGHTAGLMPLTHTGSASTGLNALGSTVATTVATPLQSPQWGADFSRSLLNMSAQAKGPMVAEMRLDPPDLGPIRISLTVHDNVMQASFVSPHAVVRQTIENALPQLQQLLAQAGIALGDASVNDQGTPGQSSGQANESGSGSTQQAGIANTGGAEGGPLAAGSVAAAETARGPAHPDALVDTFA